MDAGLELIILGLVLQEVEAGKVTVAGKTAATLELACTMTAAE